MKTGVFITGTNTDIGKTLVSSLLLAAAMAAGLNARYFKPVQTGDSDCDVIKSFLDLTDANLVHSVFSFKAPMSPHRAAPLENKTIEEEKIIAYWQSLPSAHYIVEGAGGLLAPLNKKILVRDLIKLLHLPVIIVASTQLGTINHTLLTVEAARAANLSIIGVILNGERDPGLQETIEEYAHVPVIAEVPHFQTLATAKIKATEIFPLELLQRIFNHE